MKSADFAKFVVAVNALVPLTLLAWDGAHHNLGANPTNFALHTTGMLALIFLLLSLAVTPVRLISGKNYLSNFRRMLGLFAFFYACLHLLIYFIFDRSMSITGTIGDTLKRRFIFFGMLAWLLLVPLAMTSTNASIKRLGAARWKRLHQLAYVSACAGALHYYMLVKADVRQPLIFATVLLALLAYRVLVKYFPALKARKQSKPARTGVVA